MWFVHSFSIIVLTLFLLINSAIAQSISLSGDAPRSDKPAQRKSVQRSEQQRFLTWKAKGYIPVYIFGSSQTLIKTKTTTHQIDLMKLLEEALSDLRFEIFMLPIPELRIVSQPESGAIWFGTFEDSRYLKQYDYTYSNLNKRVLSRSYGGITFVIDKNGYALDFDPEYVDSDFDRVECLIAHPQYYANFSHRLRVAGWDHQEIRFISRIEKIKLALLSITKHEIYHALGTKHIRNCILQSGNPRNCSIMASSSRMLFLHPGPEEFQQLMKIWENISSAKTEHLSKVNAGKLTTGIPY